MKLRDSRNLKQPELMIHSDDRYHVLFIGIFYAQYNVYGGFKNYSHQTAESR